MPRPSAPALVTVLLLAFGAPAAAQDLRPIRAADTVGVDAPTVYQLIERLRPEWLRVAGDPADLASRERVRVFRGGTSVGGLDALLGMPVEGLVSVRLAGPQAAVARDPRTPPDAVAAILVLYATDRRSRRVEFVVGVGRRGAAIRHRAAASLAEDGWDRSLADLHSWASPHRTPGTLFAAASMHVRPYAGVTVTAHRTGQFNVRGISPVPDPPRPPLPQTTWIGTTDLAATVFARRHMLRAAAGPALRVADYRRTTGYCECRDQETGRAVALGAAGDVGMVFPPFGPVVLQLQASVRWFPPHGIPAGGGMPRIELGGVTTYVSLGAGFGL